MALALGDSRRRPSWLQMKCAPGLRSYVKVSTSGKCISLVRNIPSIGSPPQLLNQRTKGKKNSISCTSSRNFASSWLSRAQSTCPLPTIPQPISSSSCGGDLVKFQYGALIHLIPPFVLPILTAKQTASKTPRSCSGYSTQGKAASPVRPGQREQHQRSHRVRNQRGFLPLCQFGQGTAVPIPAPSAYCSRRPRVLAE